MELEMNILLILDLVIILIIFFFLLRKRPLVVGTVRIEPKDRHTWKKK